MCPKNLTENAVTVHLILSSKLSLPETPPMITFVREYWIFDPRRRTITVNFFEQNILNIQYSFDATIKVNIYDDLYIDFSEIDAMLN